MPVFVNQNLKVFVVSGPSQPKVEGEEWSDERIKAFLELKPLDDTHPDYHVLIEAYQYMVPEFFSRFIDFFVAAGRDINALSPDNETMCSRMSQHQRAQPYLDLLKSHGAK